MFLLSDGRRLWWILWGLQIRTHHIEHCNGPSLRLRANVAVFLNHLWGHPTEQRLESLVSCSTSGDARSGTVPQIVPSAFDASQFLRCLPYRRKGTDRLVWKCLVRHHRAAESPFPSPQRVAFTRKRGMARLYIRELASPVLKSLDRHRRQINQTAFAASRLALADCDDSFQQIDLMPAKQAQLLRAQPGMDGKQDCGVEATADAGPASRQEPNDFIIGHLATSVLVFLQHDLFLLPRRRS